MCVCARARAHVCECACVCVNISMCSVSKIVSHQQVSSCIMSCVALCVGGELERDRGADDVLHLPYSDLQFSFIPFLMRLLA